MAKDAWLRQQINPPRHVQMMGSQHIADPGGTLPCLGRATMIAVVHGHQVAAIARKQRRPHHIIFGIQQHIIDGIAKCVFDRATPAVVGMSCDVLDFVHSAAI